MPVRENPHGSGWHDGNEGRVADAVVSAVTEHRQRDIIPSPGRSSREGGIVIYMKYAITAAAVVLVAIAAPAPAQPAAADDGFGEVVFGVS